MSLLINGPLEHSEMAQPVYWTKGQLHCCDAREQRSVRYMAAVRVPGTVAAAVCTSKECSRVAIKLLESVLRKRPPLSRPARRGSTNTSNGRTADESARPRKHCANQHFQTQHYSHHDIVRPVVRYEGTDKFASRPRWFVTVAQHCNLRAMLDHALPAGLFELGARAFPKRAAAATDKPAQIERRHGKRAR